MTKLPPQLFPHKSKALPTARLRFVENKAVNHLVVQELLSICANVNQWSNFGPVCALLEQRLTQLLALPDHLQVIACANATVGLHTLVAMYQHLQEKPLRWVTSAFGFYSACDGILQTADIVDCDQHGMLDLQKLRPDTFDGLIVTNMFGRYHELDSYQQYAQQHNKIMVVDGAMAFHSGGHLANTCISMHHTKPWGFGEGGCTVVEQRHAELYRDMLAFGHASPDSKINRWASNGKISDVACAYLLMRLDAFQQTRSAYQAQFQRIASIGAALGLPVLGGEGVHPGIPANVPFLFPKPTIVEVDPPVPTRKYYHPLASMPNAIDIYQRIVNVACHSEMSLLHDDQIEAFLSDLLQHP